MIVQQDTRTGLQQHTPRFVYSTEIHSFMGFIVIIKTGFKIHHSMSVEIQDMGVIGGWKYMTALKF